jgi:myosin heavy subunit
MADKKISRSYPPQSVISWSSASASQWSSKSASTIPSTILKQSSPVEPTVLMHDSRLPKELDKTKPTTKRRQTTKSSTNTSTTNNTSLHSPNQKQKTDPRRRSLSPLSQHSSTTSCTTDTTNSLVYVRDCHYVWLPAQIESLMEEVDDDNIDINETHKSGDNDINYNIDGDNKRHHIDVGIRVKGVNTTVVAKIVLPDDWVDTTDLHNNSSITEIEFNLHSAGNKNGAGRGGGGNSFGKFPTMSKTRNMNVNNDIDPTVLPEHKEQQHQQKRTYHYERCLDELNPKIPKGVNRTFSLKDYPHRELPLQNIERPRTRRRSSVRGLMTPTTIDHSNGFNRSSTNGRNKKNSKVPSPTLVNARDMADLSFLHEAAILYNLKLRHAKRLPYTRVGDIVVAVNPFQWIDGLYSLEKQAIYAQHLVWDIKDCDDYGDGYDNSNTNIKNDSRETNKDSRKHKSRENSPDSYASDANEIDTVTSLPKNDLETKHQPMAHGSFYSRLGLEPHVYESASLAYRGLAGDQQNQTILVSGESGAGKTETVKIVMSNLATIEQTRPFYHDEIVKERDDGGKVADGVTGIVRQVLESNPLFEAFGCAKTAKNANSSRFGRFTQLQFEVEDLYDAVMNQRRSLPECLLVGSYCETYLLEKSRVVSHAQGERTYHIFYQLLAAPDEEKIRIWECLKGTTSESFSYVGVSPCSSIEGKSDADTWRQTVKALKLFGFDGQVLRNLIRALCIVLQLGNLTFKPSCDDDDESIIDDDGSIISSIDELNKLAKLMGIPEDQITKAMTVRVNKIRSEEVVVKSNPVDAKSGCDALAKTIYSQIFDTLVQQINYHTSVDAQDNCDRRNIGTISLLDIFGFEKFDTNRFEQLCINYANERLQQRYVLDNFKAVREEYTAEGIEIFDFSMVDNSPVVELLEGKSCIIASLNEECLRPQGSAQSFVYKLKMAHGDKARLLTDRLQDQNEFGIKHFAGAVTVSLSG